MNFLTLLKLSLTFNMFLHQFKLSLILWGFFVICLLLACSCDKMIRAPVMCPEKKGQGVHPDDDHARAKEQNRQGGEFLRYSALKPLPKQTMMIH